MNNKVENNAYFDILTNIKQQIKSAQYKKVVAFGANRKLIMLYWNIGTTINEMAIWGNKFIENLAKDIKLEFSNSARYSVRNLKYMAKFARFFSDLEIVQRSIALISWRHNIALMDKIDDSTQKQIGVSEYKFTRQLPKIWENFCQLLRKLRITCKNYNI